MGKYGQAALIPFQLSICLQHGEETRAHSSGEATWAVLTGMEQPLAESPTSSTREERELQARRSYGTPLVDLKQMLEGDVPQDKMTCLFFVKEGIRKLSHLNTVIGNNTQFILIGDTLIGKDELVRAGTRTTNKIGKRRVRPCPKGQVTVSEQILSLAKPAHSGCSMYRTRGTSWQYQAHTSKMTEHRKEMCHSSKPVPSGTMTAARWLVWEWKSYHCTCKHVERWVTWEWKSQCSCKHVERCLQARWEVHRLESESQRSLVSTSWEVRWLVKEVNGALASTWRGDWLESESQRSLVSTSWEVRWLIKEVNGAFASTLRGEWLESESQPSLASEGLQSSW